MSSGGTLNRIGANRIHLSSDLGRSHTSQLLATALLVGFVLLARPHLSLAWSERAHQMVNAAAVENLPEPLRSYFRARKVFLVEHAADPDRWAKEHPDERPHHYTEVEAYDEYPFSDFERAFVRERREPTTLQLQHGDSIWQVERLSLRLAQAFRRGRWDEADQTAVVVGHYATDLTQPLHTVLNYDGQLTNQQGLHARFEVDVVNSLANQWVLRPQPPERISDLRARVFQEYLASYGYRNVVFAADHIAVTGRSYQDAEYLATFTRLVGLLAKRRLEAAASFTSSLWYTAWVRAGKPDLRLRVSTAQRGSPVRSAP